jgi:hypothetical protein
MNLYEAHNGDGPDESDPTAALLSQTLSEEAAMVEPSPGALQSIQQRTHTSRTREPWVFGVFGAGLATAAVITAVVLISTHNDGSPNGANPPIATPPDGTTQSTQPTNSNEPTQTTVDPIAMHDGVYDPNAAAANQVTLYYVGPKPENPQLSPRLFSETHTVTDPDDNAQLAAAHEFLTSTPIDPDYRTLWPDGVDIAGITTQSDVTNFDLVTDGNAESFWDNEKNRDLALQALARSAGLTDGAFGYSINGLSDDVAYVVQPKDDVRAFLTIDNLVEGQAVASPVTVKVSGNVNEGNVNWVLTNSDGVEVDNGYVTTSMGMWTQADIPLGNLDAGTYTIKVVEYSMEDGTTVQNLDDKSFTVE